MSLRTVVESFERRDWIIVAAAVAAVSTVGSWVAALRAIRIARDANTVAEGASTRADEATEVARAANRLSEDANTSALESRDIAMRGIGRDETAHAEPRAGPAARATLAARVDPPEVRSAGTTADFPLTLVITNYGDRDSGHARVQVHAAYVDGSLFAWEEDRHRRDRPRARVSSARLTDNHGYDVPAFFLERDVENITPTLPAQLLLVFPIHVPREPLFVPLRVIVDAEHVDDQFVADLTLPVMCE